MSGDWISFVKRNEITRISVYLPSFLASGIPSAGILTCSILIYACSVFAWWPVGGSNSRLRRERPPSWPLDQRAEYQFVSIVLFSRLKQSFFHFLRWNHSTTTKVAFTPSPRNWIKSKFEKSNNLQNLSHRFHTYRKKRRVGIALFSRAVSSQVFSAPASLTTVFGMGTGGSSPSLTPTIPFSLKVVPSKLNNFSS